MRIDRLTMALAGGTLAVTLMASSTHAAIVFYNFELGGGTTLAPETVNSNVQASAWAPGDNGNLDQSTSQNKQALDIRAMPIGTSTEVDAFDNGSYATITLAPDPGWEINFESMVFDYVAGGSAGVRSLFVRWSLDDFADNLFAADTTTSTQSTGPIDLSGFVGINVPVEFRIYTFNDDGNTARSVVIDTFQINGTVVPEPLSATMLALGGLALLRRRSVR
ncbi:MAG: hypothetical protein JJU36_13765 [Phycisphaeraceae bacterium]|nr:hypothetical protein [Phycisphaeraceae bacterium]